MASQRPGYRGPRPKRTVEGYQNEAMDRDEALNRIIDVGLVLEDVRIELRPSGDGYDALLPVESLADLCRIADRLSRTLNAYEAMYGPVVPPVRKILPPPSGSAA